MHGAIVGGGMTACGSMQSVEDHLTQVLELVTPLEAVEVSLEDGQGCALAADVAAPFPLPSFDNSSVDGYAVCAVDVADAPVSLPIVGDIPAGSGIPTPLRGMTAQHIMTGAPIPTGSDAVVRVELTDAGVDQVRIERAVAAGTDIRRVASDIAEGDVVLRAGDELTAARIGLLAAFGKAHVAVVRRPRVAVVATGSELVSLGTQRSPGTIYDANSPLLTAMIRSVGAQVSSVLVLDDNAKVAGSAMVEAARDADLVVTSGGISAGAYEVIKDVMNPLGTVTFGPVSMQPGKPQGAGTFHGTPVIALPGNPVSTFVSFEVFVRPVIRLLAGHRELERASHRAMLEGAVDRHPTFRRYRRGTFDSESGIARTIGDVGSHLLASLAQSNCLIVIPPGDGQAIAGATVDVLVTE